MASRATSAASGRAASASGRATSASGRVATASGRAASAEQDELFIGRHNSLEEVERRNTETQQAVRHLERTFTAKVLDLIPDNPEDGFDDPLGIYSSANTVERHTSKQKAVARRRGRRKVQENIFRDFGKEHDKSALHEIEVGGIVITRANFKRFWQCDRELSRWKQDLNDHNRNDKLLAEVVDRWQPPVEERQERRGKKHSKSESPERDDKEVRRASTSANQLKELQNKLKPKTLERRKAKKFDFGMDLFNLRTHESDSEVSRILSVASKGGLSRKPPPVNEVEDAIYNFLNFLMRQAATLEEAFTLIDQNGNGILSPSEFVTSLRKMGYPEDMKFFFKMLEKDNDGFINIGEFLNLKPYLLKGLETHRVKVRAPGVAQSSSRLSDNTAQQADFDATGDISLSAEFQDARDLRRVPRSDGSGAGSQPNSPGSVRRRLSGQTDASGTEGVTDVISDMQEVSPRSGVAARRPPPPRGQPPDAGRGAVPAPASPHPRGPRLPQMPQTLALLIFRNADKLHAGEAVFVNRWPLPSLRELLNYCGKACRPVVGPVEALYYPDLTPVRTCEEVKSGAIFLLKGHEGLDPPPLFFSHQETPQLTHSSSAPSLRKMHSAKEAVAADQEIRKAPSPLQLQMNAQSRSGSNWMLSSQAYGPSVGSPPWASQGLPSNPKCLNKWQADPKLGRVMMWGGLGQLPRHSNYYEWQPALRSRSGPGVGVPDHNLALM